MQSNLRDIAQAAATIAQNAGNHALQTQLSPHVLSGMTSLNGESGLISDVDSRVRTYCLEKLSDMNAFDGFFDDIGQNPAPGKHFWCVGRIDGSINFTRNLSEWTVTISLFEVNNESRIYPIIGIVYAPALGLMYMAARGQGAIRVRKTADGFEKRERILPSNVKSMKGSVISFGMSYFPEESRRALDVVSKIAGLPADIKRIGPTSLDLCKVADGTYDAYFEPSLHSWDIPAVSAGSVIVWEAQGIVHRWDGTLIRWNQANDVVASNQNVSAELEQYL
jgi:myo-inositol-1(or 4)-monophosphatase